jgi:hypothetical protein
MKRSFLWILSFLEFPAEEIPSRLEVNSMPRNSVNGLPLPPLLLELLDQDRWRHPGETVLRTAIPWIEDPLDFLLPPYELAFESLWATLFDHGDHATWMHLARSSRSQVSIQLPWLDVEQAVVIIENLWPGDDQGIALDYRTSRSDPRVVASDWVVTVGCVWREVAPTFSAFVGLLAL